jgi:thymidylate synthase
MTLPPCHYSFQVYTRKLNFNEKANLCRKNKSKLTAISEQDFLDFNIPTRAISLKLNMRSTDVGLGLPFNIASYALLLEILAKGVNMVPEELISDLGDTHIYMNHIEGLKEQITRKPYEMPRLEHLKTDVFYRTLSQNLSLISHLDSDDFELTNYKSHSKIKLPLSN